jgi:hypothetical protein
MQQLHVAVHQKTVACAAKIADLCMWHKLQDSARDTDAITIELADQHDRIMHSPLMEHKNTCKGSRIHSAAAAASLALLQCAKHVLFS